ncbi:hypothetical protein [Butyrivibrio sp. AC2005]|uniref:hypothetical protein n=1 Tax=Butyrivibrio sp. AC2005 TaxID=1280672 RepID=UPI000410E850|nr:hypothetical protein [Butyrivibrio sp. AC2005]
MKKNNPFTLTFGKQQNEYISRYENTDMILSTFEAGDVPYVAISDDGRVEGFFILSY